MQKFIKVPFRPVRLGGGFTDKIKATFKGLEVILILSLTFAACQPKQEKTPDQMTKEINAVFENYYEDFLKMFPVSATANGDHRYDNMLNNDISESYRQQIRDFYNKYKIELTKYDKTQLNANDLVSYEILEREINISLEELTFNDHLMPIQQFWGTPLTFIQMGSGKGIHPFGTAKDYDNFLGRIDGFSIWGDTAIANMKRGMAKGMTFPKVNMERVLPQFEAMLVNDPQKSLFYDPIKDLPDTIAQADKDRLKAAYTRAITEKVTPTFQKLYDFIKNEYIPACRTVAGFSAMPEGKEEYTFLTKFWTTVDMSPDTIYNTGLKEVARIRTEMEKVKTEVGFKGDLKAFFDFVNTDKKLFPYKTPDEVLDGYRNIETRMQPQLKKLFSVVPKTKFEIRQTEKFREASASAEYQPGPPDGSRPGVFYAPIPDAIKYNVIEMESLFLHEAIPGHHYQISLQQENEKLPKFRRFSWYGAYGEGWALYTESLGKELGLYTDPYQYFGALGNEMHRAIRLVVDVAIHLKGMTREEAIKYSLDNEATSLDGATAEIERYMVVPGQALSYKVGQLKIREIRAKAEKTLGDKFSISNFHDELLSDGCLPLDVLEKKMNRWIETQK
jgi:uncharacterized protein (DUF885 family)